MTNLPKIRIGTRKSPLALIQAGMVRDKLQAAWPGISVELVKIVTSGDRVTDRPLADIGGKGLFTKEIEEALLANEVDIAVHSIKDMQTILPNGLTLGCMLEREDPSDMLVGKNMNFIEDIPRGASFGTSSLRRAAQVLMRRPDLKIVPLRGNVETRLAKIESGEIAATMLATAGLKRLGLKPAGAIISVTQFLPAVAQGAIGIECRSNDQKILDLLKPLSHAPTERAVICERTFLRALDGSCRTPIAGYAEIKGEEVQFRGLIIKPDGSANHGVVAKGKAAEAEAIGLEAGKQLLAKAGKDFLK